MNIISNKLINHVLIIIVGLIVYSNTLNVPFVFDDDISITANPLIRNFNSFFESSALNNTGIEPSVRDFFSTRIIGYLTFAINYNLNGYDVTGYHIFNILVHLANALLIYWLVMFLFSTPYFSEAQWQDTPNVVALASALLFVCHPIQTQAVTYIVQRFASLATLFYLLSVVAYMWSRFDFESKARKYILYAVSVIAAVCAMKTKEISFTLPVAVVLVEFLFFAGDVKKRVIYLLPILLTMLVIPLTLLTSGGSFTIATSENVSRWDYLFTQFSVIVRYIRLFFIPVGQNLDYDYPVYRSLFEPAVFLSLLFLLSIIGVGMYLYHLSCGRCPEKRYLYLCRLIAFGIVWFFLTISIESSIIPIEDVIFEHRVYLPSVGFFTMIAAMLAAIETLKAEVIKTRKVLIPLAACLVLVLSVAAYHRNGIWRDNVTLWEDVVNKSPNKARSHNNLGMYYERQGSLYRAIEHYKTAARLKPDYVVAHMNLSRIYAMQGLTTDYLSELRMALKVYDDILRDPKAAKKHRVDAVEVAGIHYELGASLARLRLYDEAAVELEAAIRLNPDSVEAHVDLGNIYALRGSVDGAINQYQIALQLRPGSVEARNNLEIVRRKMTK
ncbi:MAG: tetratricopeptide repeat protein [Nitrospirae bacterium]|nr:tetratricopeptide repeat protein [Nitrospirota bacterium]